MKTAALSCLCLAMISCALLAFAQEKAKPEEEPIAAAKVTPVKVSITFVEFEGEKKTKSLPYTLVAAPSAKIRMGSRVPVYTGKDYGMQYLDVGSNIDCQAYRGQDNTFDVKLTLDRSWVEGDVPVAVEKGAQGANSQFPEPVIRQFKSDLTLVMRDGQTVESTFATDPLSGKVFKVEVALNLLK